MRVMMICFAIAVSLAGLGALAVGVAALTRGWVPPESRKLIVRPRLYGRGMVALAICAFLMAANWVLVTDPILRKLGQMAGFLAVIVIAHLTGASRRPADVQPQEGDKP
ncbi:hypothetical protein ACFWC5_00630 [Streptomyces sp. NPDC060085]|uniref:hypothetical protein n=1 Tax=Streptomyces sp. NPDC060085 TaxID=3347054 RepID=UPI00365BB017